MFAFTSVAAFTFKITNCNAYWRLEERGGDTKHLESLLYQQSWMKRTTISIKPSIRQQSAAEDDLFYHLDNMDD